MCVRVPEKPKCMYIIGKEGDLRNWLTGLGNQQVQNLQDSQSSKLETQGRTEIQV